MSEQKSEKRLISYHTFIFPFIWNQNGTVTRKKFEKCMHPAWEPDFREDTKSEPHENRNASGENTKKKIAYDPLLYGQYCYFNQAARNVIFMEDGDEKPIVRNFRFNIEKLCSQANWLQSVKGYDNPVRYVIRKEIYKWDKESRKAVYDYTFTASLRVNGIRLRLFSTGVGMIVFELENYDHNTDKTINMINEYGRRVFMPFCDDEGRCELCADTITLEYPGDHIESPFNGKKMTCNSDIQFMKLILKLLSNDQFSVTTNPRPDKNQFQIEPIIDDRMFVACAWNSNELPNAMKERLDGQYRYLYDAKEKLPDDPENVARRAYELIFVDGNGLSCQNRDMLHQMLEQHVYPRWLEYGTLIGVTEYSIVTATDFGPNITAFLTEYTEMAMLVLAQRASLLAFEQQISDCACGKLRVDKIQREYVQFQSKYLLREVTPQQQGIELYNMLLKNLFISDMQGDLEKQINALFALERDASDRDDNRILSALAILGIVEAIDFFANKPGWVSVLASGLIAAGLAFLFLHNHRNRLK